MIWPYFPFSIQMKRRISYLEQRRVIKNEAIFCARLEITQRNIMEEVCWRQWCCYESKLQQIIRMHTTPQITILKSIFSTFTILFIFDLFFLHKRFWLRFFCAFFCRINVVCLDDGYWQMSIRVVEQELSIKNSENGRKLCVIENEIIEWKRRKSETKYLTNNSLENSICANNFHTCAKRNENSIRELCLQSWNHPWMKVFVLAALSLRTTLSLLYCVHIFVHFTHFIVHSSISCLFFLIHHRCIIFFRCSFRCVSASVHRSNFPELTYLFCEH